jgi:hypothetical protein
VHRHRFDPVSVVVGAVFVAAAIIVLSGGRLTDEGRILLPIGLVAFGVALLGQAARPREHPAPAVAPVVSAPPVPPAEPEPVPPAEPVPSQADLGPAESDPALADTVADADPDPDVDAETAGPGTDFYFGTGWQSPRPDPEDEP